MQRKTRQAPIPRSGWMNATRSALDMKVCGQVGIKCHSLLRPPPSALRVFYWQRWQLSPHNFKFFAIGVARFVARNCLPAPARQNSKILQARKYSFLGFYPDFKVIGSAAAGLESGLFQLPMDWIF